MKTINLRDFYPEIYTNDHFVSIPDDVFYLLLETRREDTAYRVRTYRHRAYYSLDYGDDIERKALFMGLSPYDLYEHKLAMAQLYAALASLPDKQAKRIYAHYFLGMSKAAIARAERAAESSVKESIARGLSRLKKILSKNI